MTIRTLNICCIIYQYDYADLLTEIFFSLALLKSHLLLMGTSKKLHSKQFNLMIICFFALFYKNIQHIFIFWT